MPRTNMSERIVATLISIVFDMSKRVSRVDAEVLLFLESTLNNNVEFISRGEEKKEKRGDERITPFEFVRHTNC